MILNIKGDKNNINDGDIKEPYKGPAPPQGSDPHHLLSIYVCNR